MTIWVGPSFWNPARLAQKGSIVIHNWGLKLPENSYLFPHIPKPAHVPFLSPLVKVKASVRITLVSDGHSQYSSIPSAAAEHALL